MARGGAPADAAGLQPAAVFLLDAGPLGGLLLNPSSSSRAAPWTPPAHHLDSVERLVACHSLVRDRRPSARLLVFVEAEGYRRLCRDWQGGGPGLAVPPASVQCVPFGCEVGDFLVEVARQRAADGAEVFVVSNVADTVVKTRAADPRVVHLGFMFVDGAVVMPGLPAQAKRQASPAGGTQWASRGGGGGAGGALQRCAKRPRSHFQQPPLQPPDLGAAAAAAALGGRELPRPHAGATAGGVEATAAAGGAAGPPRAGGGAAGGGGTGGEVEGRRPGATGKDDDSETIRDSQLDGEALDTLVDEADDLYADTVVDYAPTLDLSRMQAEMPSLDAASYYDEVAYADTLVDADVDMVAALTPAAPPQQPRSAEPQLPHPRPPEPEPPAAGGEAAQPPQQQQQPPAPLEPAGSQGASAAAVPAAAPPPLAPAAEGATAEEDPTVPGAVASTPTVVLPTLGGAASAAASAAEAAALRGSGGEGCATADAPAPGAAEAPGAPTEGVPVPPAPGLAEGDAAAGGLPISVSSASLTAAPVGLNAAGIEVQPAARGVETSAAPTGAPADAACRPHGTESQGRGSQDRLQPPPMQSGAAGAAEEEEVDWLGPAETFAADSGRALPVGCSQQDCPTVASEVPEVLASSVVDVEALEGP